LLCILLLFAIIAAIISTPSAPLFVGLSDVEFFLTPLRVSSFGNSTFFNSLPALILSNKSPSPEAFPTMLDFLIVTGGGGPGGGGGGGADEEEDEDDDDRGGGPGGGAGLLLLEEKVLKGGEEGGGV
jgi:hypothetical protein